MGFIRSGLGKFDRLLSLQIDFAGNSFVDLLIE